MSTLFTKGSILFALYASIAMVAVIGMSAMNLMKGPVRAMSLVTQRTIAENNMIAAGKLALIVSAEQPGDCDADGLIEPVEWATPPAGQSHPINGGVLPPTIGASLQDPWGNSYGYCAWDHGTIRRNVACGSNANRLEGANDPQKLVIAIISSGPDKTFQTGCQADGQGEYLLRIPGNDDVVLSYSFAEAVTLSAGLWNLKENDLQTATIAKNLSVTDSGGNEQLTFDTQSKELSLAAGGTGELPNIRTDYIQNLSANAPIEFLSNIKTGDAWISGDGTDKGLKISAAGDVDLSGNVAAGGTISAGSAAISTADANAVAAIVTASGASGIGLKAAGTSKAIEAQGVLDMTTHKIINLAAPTADTDAATKKYVDDKSVTAKRVKCEAFIFSGCTGGTTQNLTKTSLGDCKKACENANVSCCAAQYATTVSDPNTTLGQCVGHAGGKPNNSLINLLAGLIVPASIGAYCYEQY